MITKVKWKNHNILGDLELDFTKDRKPMNTIVIAGENGTGKTTILETLATFLSGNSIIPFDSIEYFVGNEGIRVYYDETVRLPDAGQHKRHILETGEVLDIEQCNEFNPGQMLKDKLDVRSYGVAYSKAQVGFKTKPVISTTTIQLDVHRQSIDDNNDSDDDFTKIK